MTNEQTGILVARYLSALTDAVNQAKDLLPPEAYITEDNPIIPGFSHTSCPSMDPIISVLEEMSEDVAVLLGVDRSETMHPDALK
jgi:citrate synthase